MAPKNLPPAAKQAKILTWFQETMGVYTLKELEKVLQSVASINGIQVKEYLQALQDENLIRVEKIGSGNWYWCFLSDAKKGKENTLNTLRIEEEKLKGSIKNTEKLIEEEMAMRAVDDEVQEDTGGLDRKKLMEAYEELVRELEILDKELSAYSESDPQEVLRKIEETKRLKHSAVVFTDNIESMESFFASVLQGDRQKTGKLMAEACMGDLKADAEYEDGKSVIALSASGMGQGESR